MKALALRLHRWVALIFALPLLAVLLTGLVLSFEPWLVSRAIQPGSLTGAQIEAALARHDPLGQARAIAYRSYDGSLTIGAGRGGTVVDAATGEARQRTSALADLLLTARRLHETLLLDAGWLVVGTTVAMLALIALGVLMGIPRIANTLAGWHKAMAWGLLPLIVLSPLTGLLLSAGITLSGSPPRPASVEAPLSLREAVRIVGASHDLSNLVWLRPQGGRTMVRLVDGGEFRVYAVSRDGTPPMPRNWPRLWHEGNFAGAWSAGMNAILSAAMIGLLVTGTWIWLRRKLRRAARRSARAVTGSRT
jgi:uncharacterized iron-regulated membrane protein